VYVPVFRGKIETLEGTTIVRVRVSNTYTTFQIGFGWAWSVALFCIGARIALRGVEDIFTAIVFMLFGLFAAAGQLFWTSWYFQKVEGGKKRLLSLFVVKTIKRTIRPRMYGKAINNDEGSEEGATKTS